jgi:hypothetical protein
MWWTKKTIDPNLQRALFETAPITVKYQRPADIGLFEGRSLANDAERQLFKDFARFAMLFNRQFESIPDLGPWRIQELDDTDTDILGAYACRYDVFHGQMRVGNLEISPGIIDGYTTDSPTVCADVTIEHVLTLPFGRMWAFLEPLSIYLTGDDETKRRADVNHALLALIWPGNGLQDDPGLVDLVELNIRFEGSAANYIEYKDGCET